MTSTFAPAAAQGDRTTPVRRTRMTDLEGYRGLAAVGIVVFHAYQFARGNASASYAYPHTVWQHILRNLDGLVSMFLILSGFLLYLPLAANVLAGRRGVVRVFLLRRAARILPLYWVATAVVWSARNPAWPGDWRDLVEHLSFTQVFDSKRIFYTIGPAWSLSVEVWFYLFLALTYVGFNRVAGRVTNRRARIGLLLVPPVFLVAISLGWQCWALATDQPATRWAVWFNPVARADMVGVGMLVAVLFTLRTSRTPMTRVVLIPLRLAALGLLVVGCAIRTDAADRSVAFNLLSTVAFGLLIASSVFDDARHAWRRVLAGPRLAWLGLVSYSLYLWHEPVLLWLDDNIGLNHAQRFFPLTALILVAASLPVAWLSFRIIERPLGRLRLLLDDSGRQRNYYPTTPAAPMLTGTRAPEATS